MGCPRALVPYVKPPCVASCKPPPTLPNTSHQPSTCPNAAASPSNARSSKPHDRHSFKHLARCPYCCSLCPLHQGQKQPHHNNAELYSVHMPSLATSTCMLHTGGQHVCCNQGCARARARAVRELCMDKLQCARHKCFCAAAQCAFIQLSALTPFLRHREQVTNNCMSTGNPLPSMWHTSTFIHCD